MGFNDHFTSGDRLDLQTVYFKHLLNLGDKVPEPFAGFSAACAFYRRVKLFIAIARPALGEAGRKELNQIIQDYNEKWAAIKTAERQEQDEDPLKGPTIIMDAATITYNCSVDLLGTTMEFLDAAGITRTRKKGAIAAFGEIDANGVMHVRLDKDEDRNSDEDDDEYGPDEEEEPEGEPDEDEEAEE